MLSKICIQCNKEFQKPYKRSVADFLRRAKYCSKDCADTFKRGKPFFNSGSFKKGNPAWLKDLKNPSFAGANNPKWKGGKVKFNCFICKNDYEVLLYRAEKSKFCSRNCKQIYEKSIESRLHLSLVHKNRVTLGLHNLYRGITELKALLRQTSQYKIWRGRVYERDEFTCQFCDVVGGELNADHIKSFAVIIVENNVKTYDDAMNCGELWDVENGRTLCVPCHKKTETYGRFAPAFITATKVKQIINL